MDEIRRRPVRSPFTAPLARGLPIVPAASPAPLDVVQTSAAAPAAGWKDRLCRIARNVLIGTVATTTLIGTIAVVGNSDAIFAPVTISRPVLAVPAASPRNAKPAASSPARASQTPAPVVASVSGARVPRLAHDFEQRPDVQAAFQHRVDEARAAVDQQLQHLEPVALEELIDVQAPLPTGERAFLHLGRLDLPSAGLSALAREQIPVVVRGTVQPGSVAVRMDVTPETLETPPHGPPGAVYVGSVHTVVRAAAPSVHLDGRVEVVADLDGQATQRALDTWKTRQAQTPPSSAQRAAIDGNVARLETRLAQVRRLAALEPSKHFVSVLNQALADQGATFSRDVLLPADRPLADGVHHLWLGAADAQGRPTLIVTGTLQTPGIDGLKLSGDAIDGLPHTKVGGMLGEELNRVIRERVQGEIASQLGESAGQLPDQVRGMVADAWRDATGQIQAGGGAALAHAVDGHRDIALVPAHAGQNESLSLTLQSIAPTTPGGLGTRADLHIGGARVTGDVTRLLARPDLLPDAVRQSPALLAVSGDALNVTLRDVHEGGAVDWRGFLSGVARQNGLKSLEFNHDDGGRMMSPQLTWKNGQACLELDLSAQSKGLFPVGGRAAKGPVAASAPSTAKSPLAAGGTATAAKGGFLGGVPLTGAPLGGVLDGVGSILVDSIGALLNPFPYVSMHLSIPIQFQAADGVLTLRPAASGVEVGPPRGSSDHIPLPTNILQTIMAQLLIGSGARIGDGLQNVSVPLDLRDHGVHVTAAAAVAPNGTAAPDLAVGLDPSLPR